MAERRAFARKKRRFLVEFSLQGAACNGFTYDVSPSGIFVRSTRLPNPGTYLTANLHLPEGKRIAVPAQHDQHDGELGGFRRL